MNSVARRRLRALWFPITVILERRRDRRGSSPLRKLWRSWHDEITRPGKYLVGMILLAGLGTVSVTVPVYQLFCGLATILAVSMLAGFALIPAVSISGRMPAKATAGERLNGHFRITNRSRLRPAIDLGIGLFDLPAGIMRAMHDPTIAWLPAGRSVELSLEIIPLRRGAFEFPGLHAFTTFPFNIFRIGMPQRQPQSLLVLPSFHPLTRLDLPLATRYQPGGVALTSNIGESPEYIGNREYVPGEPARRLDFRSWARLGAPVVREYHEEYYCRIALILDTFVSEERRIGVAGNPTFEAAVSLTAALADVLSGGEYLIDLFAAGPELYVFRAGRHTAHFENILEILSCVETSPADPFDTIAPAIADELENISTAICIFLDSDARRHAMVRSIVEAGCQVKVIVVTDDHSRSDHESFADVAVAQVVPASRIRNGDIEHL